MEIYIEEQPKDDIYMIFARELAETIEVLRDLEPEEYWQRTAELRREARRQPFFQNVMEFIDSRCGYQMYNLIANTQPLRDC